MPARPGRWPAHGRLIAGHADDAEVIVSLSCPASCGYPAAVAAAAMAGAQSGGALAGSLWACAPDERERAGESGAAAGVACLAPGDAVSDLVVDEARHQGHGPPSQPPRAWEQAFPGTADQVRHVRGGVRSLLGDCPVTDDVVLIMSELAANAVAHSASGMQGGTFTARVQHLPGECVRGEVEDVGSSWHGDLRESARDASGLLLVLRLASGCGVTPGTAGGRVVWFRKQYPATSRRPGQKSPERLRAAPAARFSPSSTSREGRIR